MGENGAGKSTLIKALTGVYSIDAGSITVAGRGLALLPAPPMRKPQESPPCTRSQPLHRTSRSVRT